MSYLRQINEHLESTRELTIQQLNNLILELDRAAQPLTHQGIAHTVLGYMMSARLKGEDPSFVDGVARAERLKANQEWLYVDPAVKVAPPPPPVKQSKADAAPVKSKRDLAREIYDGLEDKSKANVIRVLMERLQTSQAGAQTYYYGCTDVREGSGPKEAPVKDEKPANTAPSKKMQAQALFDAAPDKSKDAIVALLMHELKLSVAGASTYYYSCTGAQRRK